MTPTSRSCCSIQGVSAFGRGCKPHLVEIRQTLESILSIFTEFLLPLPHASSAMYGKTDFRAEAPQLKESLSGVPDFERTIASAILALPTVSRTIFKAVRIDTRLAQGTERAAELSLAGFRTDRRTGSFSNAGGSNLRRPVGFVKPRTTRPPELKEAPIKSDRKTRSEQRTDANHHLGEQGSSAPKLIEDRRDDGIRKIVIFPQEPGHRR